jgi:acyl-CoA thioester hydrolase
MISSSSFHIGVERSWLFDHTALMESAEDSGLNPQASTNVGSPSDAIAIRVRYNECDPMGVAHHTVYPVWFEMGRTELLRQSQTRMTYRDFEAAGVFLAVVALEVRYKRPAKYDDVLTLRTALIEAGHVKIEHQYELMRDGVLLATGSTTLACLDRQGRPQPLPDSLRTPSQA